MSTEPPASFDDTDASGTEVDSDHPGAAPDGAPVRYASITPAGCYHAVETDTMTPERRRLRELLHVERTPAATALDDGSPESASLGTLLEAGFARLADESESLPPGSLSDHLPTLLPALSERGRVVLTESRQGLFLDYVGVGVEEAEELAVLASRLRATADRASSLLVDRLGIDSRAFGIVDPAGASDIGFWPLHIGQNVFTLTILGIPRFNSAEFRQLVWVLSERYGDTVATTTHPSRPVPPA